MPLYDNGWWQETVVNAIYRIAPMPGYLPLLFKGYPDPH